MLNINPANFYYFLKGIEKCCHYLFCVELLYVGCECKYISLHKVNSTVLAMLGRCVMVGGILTWWNERGICWIEVCFLFEVNSVLS